MSTDLPRPFSASPDNWKANAEMAARLIAAVALPPQFKGADVRLTLAFGSLSPFGTQPAKPSIYLTGKIYNEDSGEAVPVSRDVTDEVATASLPLLARLDSGRPCRVEDIDYELTIDAGPILETSHAQVYSAQLALDSLQKSYPVLIGEFAESHNSTHR